MDDVTRVEWREWGSAAFSEAAAADAPILLSLTATWCDHCHEMDAETYAEPRIAANVNDGFVPVRIDADRRPRVRDRYTVGGFPSTVFLAPDGRILSGAGYLDPDSMREAIDSVRSAWRSTGADGAQTPNPLQSPETPRGTLNSDVERRMLVAAQATFDAAYGGWGGGPKFPQPDAIEFALKRDRSLALRALDAIEGSLFDPSTGGFSRYASERDWSGVRREKLLDVNASMLRAFANAYLYTGADRYRTTADRTVAFLTARL